MTHLKGVPLYVHLDTIFSEYKMKQSIYNLKNKFIFKGFKEFNLQIKLHNKKIATPIGPAAGPQTQLSQNIVLSYLAGSRIIELKTIQILDKLKIHRPCIDVRNIGFNIEWSQELSLNESKNEYIKAYIILKILEESEILGPKKGDPFYNFIFDLSIGYNLKGIVSHEVSSWLYSMLNAKKEIQEELKNLPKRFAKYRSININPHISNSITLSTFHGCPSNEIEKIAEHLIHKYNAHVIVKFNPTLLGYDSVYKILNNELGYENIKLDKNTFNIDITYENAVLMMNRLKKIANNYNKNIGAKFTNTLIVKNNENIFNEKIRYLSGTPLHVLAIKTMHKMREFLGASFLMSFSGGVNKNNFADTIACNLKPVTACTDLLKQGGYSRIFYYLKNLTTRMKNLNTFNIDDFIKTNCKLKNITTHEAGIINSKQYSINTSINPKYNFKKNHNEPKYFNLNLNLFDCLNCGLCISACPNASNAAINIGIHDIIYNNYIIKNDILKKSTVNRIQIKKSLQFINLADFCNECGNCNTYCPEKGAPFTEKARFFSSIQSFKKDQRSFALFFESPYKLLGKINKNEYSLSFIIKKKYYIFSSIKLKLILDSNNKLIDFKIKNLLIKNKIINMKPFYIMRLYLDCFLKNKNNFPTTILQRNSNE